MAFQTTIPFRLGLGVPGEIYGSGPFKAASFRLVSADAAYNVFGRGFSVTSEGVAAAGNAAGTKIWAGILVGPKEHANRGNATDGPLGPSLVLPNQVQADLCTEGSIIVTLPAACAIGDLVVYDNTTGALSTIAPGADLPVGKSSAHAFVDVLTVTAAGLAVITLLNAPIVPVLA